MQVNGRTTLISPLSLSLSRLPHGWCDYEDQRFGCSKGDHRQKVPWAGATHLLSQRNTGASSPGYSYSFPITAEKLWGLCSFLGQRTCGTRMGITNGWPTWGWHSCLPRGGMIMTRPLHPFLSISNKLVFSHRYFIYSIFLYHVLKTANFYLYVTHLVNSACLTNYFLTHHLYITA